MGVESTKGNFPAGINNQSLNKNIGISKKTFSLRPGLSSSPSPFATYSTMLGTLLRRNMSQKLSVLLLVFGLAWGLMLLRYTVQQPRHQSSAELREQILELSRQYVKVLTEENQNALGGLQGTSMAGYGKWLRRQECCFIVKKCTQALICIWFSFSSSCTQLIWRGL